MAYMDGSQKKEVFSEALQDKNIPVLTLDHKWYRLLDELGKSEVKDLEKQLNTLLKKQGKLNTKSRELKLLKKKLMGEIVPMVNEAEQSGDEEIEDKIESHKRLIEECNEKLEEFQDDLLDLPRQIEQINRQLMLKTMENCYRTMQNNTDEIQEIEEWVTQIRIELKKRLIHKQEMEQKNHEIYTYMHDVFGAEVLNLFDMRYDPDKQHPTVPQKESGENKE